MEKIAIVGMAGRFPGAPDLASFWRNIEEGRDSISRFPAEPQPGAASHEQSAASREQGANSSEQGANSSEQGVRFNEQGANCKELDASSSEHGTASHKHGAPEPVRARGVLEGIEDFDARFFRFLPREAELLDPQQRVFLELAWQAIEHAGYDVARFAGAIGVYAGCFLNSYLFANLCSQREFLERFVDAIQTDALAVELASEKDYLATQTAFRLGLRGPAVTVQTACSTALVAAATACRSLAARECDMALAGGVTIVVPQERGYVPHEGSILSADGTCRPFDAAASGTVFSNGAGVLLLRRLDDAIAAGDTIYAVIRGWAVNNDGNRKVNYTAPSAAGQAEVVGRALAAAQVDARTIGYVEAHGTATPVGDPIEVAGLTTAYARHTADTGFCALGSVKANIGHLDVAAGAASLIKVALALHEGVIPPLAHYRAPNPKIDFARTPFYINTKAQAWPAAQPRRAALSSFGLGGTNVHMVLEEAPAPRLTAAPAAAQIVLLSAPTDTALATQAERLAAHLETSPELADAALAASALADMAFTTQVGRRQFDRRRFVVGATACELAARLRAAPRPGELGKLAAVAPPVVFQFPGQGSQYPGMGRTLYEAEPVFRAAIDRCCAALAADPACDFDLRRYLLAEGAEAHPDGELARSMAQTCVAQPAIFALEVALARLFVSWGVAPTAVLGHSVGEFAAAVLAGVFGLDDAARLVALRGRLMQAQPAGQMLAVRAPAAAVQPLLGAQLAIAVRNAPEMLVVSGPQPAIEAFAQRAAAAGLPTTALRTSHAFHSEMMRPVLAPLAAALADVPRSDPQVPFWSTALARELTAAEVRDPAYWAAQVLEPVRFAEAIAALGSHRRCAWLEVGPRQGLSGFCRQTLAPGRSHAIVAALPEGDARPEREQALGALGRLWLAGVAPDWARLHGGLRRRVALPGYPFERQRYWIEASPRPAPAAQADEPPAQRGKGAAAPLASVAGEGSAPGAAPAPALPPAAHASPHELVLARLVAGAAQLSGYPVEALEPAASFLDLGFDSLFMTQLAANWQQEFGVPLSFRRLLDDFPSLDALAAHLLEEGAAVSGVDSAPAPDSMSADPAQRQSAQRQSAQPQSAQPQSAQPQSAQPQSAQPQSAQPQSAQPQASGRGSAPVGQGVTPGRPASASTPGTEAGGSNGAAVAVGPGQAASAAGEGFPLLESQQELWIAAQAGPEVSCAFNESDILRISGPLDAGLLARALGIVLDRHEALRLRFDLDGECQWADASARAQIVRLDFSGQAEAEREEALAILIAHAAGDEFDLENGPTMRAWLVRLAPTEHALVLYFHHLVFDGYSGALILGEAFAAYEAARRGEPAPVSTARPYREYVACVQARSAQRARDLAYWRTVFASPPVPLDLPLDRPRPRQPDYAGSTIHRELPPATLDALRALARAQGCTLFNLLLGAFQCLLARLTGQDDLVVAIPAAGQVHLGIETVGYCVTSLPIRAQADEDKPFAVFLRELRTTLLDAIEHQDLGIGQIARALRLGSSRGTRSPLGEVYFNCSSYLAAPALDGCRVRAHENPRRYSFYDLFLHIVETDQRLVLDCDYRTALFDGATISRWLDHYTELLRGIVADPQTEIGVLPLLPPAGPAAIATRWTQG